MPRLKSHIQFGLLSRETLLLINTVLLLVAMATVFLGTLYPLFIQVFGLGKLSVGPPYFNSVFVPLMVPVFFLMGVGPHCQWQQMSLTALYQKMKWSLILTIGTAFILTFYLGGDRLFSLFIGLALALWILTSTFQLIGQRGVFGLRISQWGMVCAHIGVATTIIGITCVSHYHIEKDVRMQIGDTVTLDKYQVHFAQIKGRDGPNYRAVEGVFNITKKGQPIAILHPQKRIYMVGRMAMTDADILAGLFRDIYIALGETLSPNTWSVRLYYKPFIRWIWLGGILMLMGGLLAVGGRRFQSRQVFEKQKEVLA